MFNILQLLLTVSEYTWQTVVLQHSLQYNKNNNNVKLVINIKLNCMEFCVKMMERDDAQAPRLSLKMQIRHTE